MAAPFGQVETQGQGVVDGEDLCHDSTPVVETPPAPGQNIGPTVSSFPRGSGEPETPVLFEFEPEPLGDFEDEATFLETPCTPPEVLQFEGHGPPDGFGSDDSEDNHDEALQEFRRLTQVLKDRFRGGA